MRSPSLEQLSRIERRKIQTLPPGTGFLLAGGVSLLVWAMIAGLATII